MSALIAIPQDEFQELKDQLRDTNIMVKELILIIKSDERLKNETYLTTAEVTERFKISKATLYRKLNRGKIECSQAGRVKRWKLSLVEREFSKRKLLTTK